MPWLELTLQSSHPEWVEEVLESMGAQSVSFHDAGDEPLLEPPPGATPLWRDTIVRALFATGIDLDAVRDVLGQALPADGWRGWQVTRVEDADWVRAWQASEAPRRFHRLWICPTHAHVTPAAGEAVVRLDAGLGFGTGGHPTTALCLDWLARADLAGCTVLDYGCGSGILAVAALHLGARRATAIDIDPQALEATRENARRNDVEDRLRIVAAGAEEALSHFDVIVANILARPLIELAPTLLSAARPGGSIMLTGLLKEQDAAVREAYDGGIDHWQMHERDGWIGLVARRADRT